MRPRWISPRFTARFTALKPYVTPSAKLCLPLALALVALVGQAMYAMPASACGALVAPNGAVRLQRATTLVAWHDGIEHYLTTFTYEGDVPNLGFIIPLPAAPIQPVQEGGAWTLQRLVRESHPVTRVALGGADAPVAASSAQVLQQVQIEALNVTVVEGSGDEIIQWATGNGFALDSDTRAHLQVYAHASPFFMAAKYDTSAAQARHQIQGDGTPVLITMRTAHPWVPLEVLAIDGQPVHADLFLLSDMPLYTGDLAAVVGQPSVGNQLPGAPGFTLAFQERMNASLYHDLSTDRNMSWVRPDGWLTYLSLDASEEQVTYDLGVSNAGVIRLAPFGTAPMNVVDRAQPNALPDSLPHFPLGTPEVAAGIALLLAFLLVIAIFIRAGLHSPAKQANQAHQAKQDR
jgi:hypothetical protein